MEDTDLVKVTKSGILISDDLARMILDSEKRAGVRGAGSKKLRIKKKIVKRRLMSILNEYIEEYLCTKKSLEE